MHLLHGHILQRLGAATAVFLKHSWPHAPPQPDSGLDERLRAVDPKYPQDKDKSPVFCLLDEVHTTYGDTILWNSFFKNVADGHSIYRVVLFAVIAVTFRVPSLRFGAPLILHPNARISLSRMDVECSVGILLELFEFDQVISRFEHPMKLQPNLQDLIFTYTDGHVGAVVELLRMMWNEVGVFRGADCLLHLTFRPQSKSYVLGGAELTVAIFDKKLPVTTLLKLLNGGAFARGLPLARDVV